MRKIQTIDELGYLFSELRKAEAIENQAKEDYWVGKAPPSSFWEYVSMGVTKAEKARSAAEEPACNAARKQYFEQCIQLSPELAHTIYAHKKDYDRESAEIEKIFTQWEVPKLGSAVLHAGLAPSPASAVHVTTVFANSVRKLRESWKRGNALLENYDPVIESVLEEYKLTLTTDGKFVLELGAYQSKMKFTEGRRHSAGVAYMGRGVVNVGIDPSLKTEDFIKVLAAAAVKEELGEAHDTSWIDLAEGKSWAQKEVDKNKGEPDQQSQR